MLQYQPQPILTLFLWCIVENMQKIKVEQHAICGGFWFAAWMFTIGILDLHFWQGVWAIVIWPYYLGHALTMWL